jgi:hypothetical protein
MFSHADLEGVEYSTMFSYADLEGVKEPRVSSFPRPRVSQPHNSLEFISFISPYMGMSQNLVADPT